MMLERSFVGVSEHTTDADWPHDVPTMWGARETQVNSEESYEGRCDVNLLVIVRGSRIGWETGLQGCLVGLD